MQILETDIAGVHIVELARKVDDRGFFARIFCESELAARGLHSRFPQWSLSHNLKRGSLRGMHFRKAPFEETKLVRCVKGSIFDVVVDLRNGSATYGKWFGAILSEDNGRALYIPEGCAHGFQALADNSDLIYAISRHYEPGSDAGVRWNDQAFSIRWPLEVATISERDSSYEDWRP